ncbi:MAG: FAD-dependent oxidoreductase [Pseudomonadota bacterium]
MSAPGPTMLLIGGGHTHLAVLADWIRNGPPAPNLAVLTPSKHLRYSGMVPGWISGEHASDAGLVDVEALARRAGAEFIADRCVSLDPLACKVLTAEGRVLSFDIASIDTGGVGRAARILGDDPRILDVRPIDRFAEALNEWRDKARDGSSHIAVAGGGAGGVELAFALRHWRGAKQQAKITLVEGAEGLLPGFSATAHRLVAGEMAAQGIERIEGDARIADGTLLAGNTLIEPVDLIVTALGSAAPDWPGASGLATDEEGFIAVDRYQRSHSHPHIFAAGDVASRQDRPVPRSGVHAVHAGPVLAANLREALSGMAPKRSYRPRPASLYLLSTANGSAIATYGPLAAQGRWAAKLKRWIDKRWIASYADLSNAV